MYNITIGKNCCALPMVIRSRTFDGSEVWAVVFVDISDDCSSLASVTDGTLRTQNQSFALLQFDREMHGVHEYLCQATNKHGMMNLVIYAIIPSSTKERFIAVHSLLVGLDMAIKPWLNSSEVQSRSVRLDCHLTSEEHADRLNHFIIYYRPWNVLEEDEGIDHIEDYQQILVDARLQDGRFTFLVIIEWRESTNDREIVVVFRSTIWFHLLIMNFDWKLFLVPHPLITRIECWSPPWTPFRTKSIKSLDTDGIERRWSFVGHRRNSAMDLVS